MHENELDSARCHECFYGIPPPVDAMPDFVAISSRERRDEEDLVYPSRGPPPPRDHVTTPR